MRGDPEESIGDATVPTGGGELADCVTFYIGDEADTGVGVKAGGEQVLDVLVGGDLSGVTDGGGTAGGAQAESARAGGVPAGPKSLLAGDRDALCDFGDEADKSGGTQAENAGSVGFERCGQAEAVTTDGRGDCVGTLHAADLPRPPELGGCLKDGADHDHGCVGLPRPPWLKGCLKQAFEHDPGCLGGADPVTWWQEASGRPGALDIVELFAAELPRPPEAQWLVYLEGLGVDMMGYLDNFKRTQSGRGDRIDDLRGDVGFGIAILDDEGDTKRLAASNSTYRGGSRRSGRHAKGGRKGSRA